MSIKRLIINESLKKYWVKRWNLVWLLYLFVKRVVNHPENTYIENQSTNYIFSKLLIIASYILTWSKKKSQCKHLQIICGPPLEKVASHFSNRLVRNYVYKLQLLLSKKKENKPIFYLPTLNTKLYCHSSKYLLWKVSQKKIGIQ
jgi:hypothetical protein